MAPAEAGVRRRPDGSCRIEMMRAAIEIATSNPLEVDRESADSWCERNLTEPTAASLLALPRAVGALLRRSPGVQMAEVPLSDRLDRGPRTNTSHHAASLRCLHVPASRTDPVGGDNQRSKKAGGAARDVGDTGVAHRRGAT